MSPQPYYIQKLKEHLALRQARSSSYSMRAYARDLGLPPGTLNQIVNGKRTLPLKDSERIVEKLSLSVPEKNLFLESLHKYKASIDNIKLDLIDDRVFVDESCYNVIAEWEHYATLTLFDLPGFTPTAEEIARRLSLTPLRAEEVLEGLVASGLLQQTDAGLKKSQESVRTTEDAKSKALRASHIETLEMGKEKLELPIELRDFSCITLAMDLKKMSEAKMIIREFRLKMAALLKDGEKTDVVQLAIQFYPVTNVSPK